MVFIAGHHHWVRNPERWCQRWRKSGRMVDLGTSPQGAQPRTTGEYFVKVYPKRELFWRGKLGLSQLH